jgi:hypothetical protein
MDIQTITLDPLRRVKPVKVIIPERYTLLEPGQPKLPPVTTGSKIGVARVYEDSEAYLSPKTMLRRAVRADQSPIDNLQDLEEILAHKPYISDEYLVTDIKLRGPDGEYVLCLWREARKWFVWSINFRPFNRDKTFARAYAVLCYGK